MGGGGAGGAAEGSAFGDSALTIDVRALPIVCCNARLTRARETLSDTGINPENPARAGLVRDCCEILLEAAETSDEGMCSIAARPLKRGRFATSTASSLLAMVAIRKVVGQTEGLPTQANAPPQRPRTSETKNIRLAQPRGSLQAAG